MSFLDTVNENLQKFTSKVQETVGQAGTFIEEKKNELLKSGQSGGRKRKASKKRSKKAQKSKKAKKSKKRKSQRRRM
jgi:hypothetical protein